MTDIGDLLAEISDDPVVLPDSYAGTCNGGPWHGAELTAVTGKVMVEHQEPTVQGRYSYHPRYRTWIWDGWL